MNPCYYNIERFTYKTKTKVKKTIEDRKEDFRKMMRNFIRENDKDYSLHPKWMYVEFVDKYTEETKGGRKFLYETCSTWDTKKRLATWRSNSEQWHPKKWKPTETQIEYTKPKQALGYESDYVPPVPDYAKHAERVKGEVHRGSIGELIRKQTRR